MPWSRWSGASPKRLALATRTSNYSASSQTVGNAADIFASDISITSDGTSSYVFEFYCFQAYVEASSNSAVFVGLVKGDGTSLFEIANHGRGTSANVSHNVLYAKFRYTPAAGTASFNARGYYGTNNTGGNPTLSASTDNPMWLAIYEAEKT